MAQDDRIYEAVCLQNGHDLFVMPEHYTGGRLALCKKCGAEVRVS